MDALGNILHAEPAPLPPRVSINDFPVEILIHVFSNLSPVEFGTLRLVCHKWNYALSDKSVWANAFSNRFGTGPVFASATRSHMWLLEYYGRISATKRWAKLKASAQLYRLINNEYGMVSHVETDFVHDRILVSSTVSGAISYCTLTLGKNQVFIPDDPYFSRILAHDASWAYLCWGRTTGEIYLKNLATSTASGPNRLSLTKLREAEEGTEVAIKSVILNRDPDKFKGKSDILSVTASGLLEFWSLSGTKLSTFDLEEETFFLDTDFKLFVVAVTSLHVLIVSFESKEILHKFEHGWEFLGKPVAAHVDFGDNNLVICTDLEFRVFHFDSLSFSVLDGKSPQDVQIIDGTMQKSRFPRNKSIMGSDGLLYALTLSDGSVCVFNIRDAPSNIKFTTRIMPFSDSRFESLRQAAQFTKVAINSSVVAIGSFTDWIHIYDSHLGEYLREGTKLQRKVTREGVGTISKIEFGPSGACGVVVCGDIVQFFRFGEAAAAKQKPNTPVASDTSNKRELHRHIKAQIDDYDSQEHIRHTQEKLADKYNGTNFESEQDELRMAMALSASCTNTEDDLERALALLRQESERNLSQGNFIEKNMSQGNSSQPNLNLYEDFSNLKVAKSDNVHLGSTNFGLNDNFDEEDLKMALQLSQQENDYQSEGPVEGSSRSQQSQTKRSQTSDQSNIFHKSQLSFDEEELRRVLELLLIDH